LKTVVSSLVALYLGFRLNLLFEFLWLAPLWLLNERTGIKAYQREHAMVRNLSCCLFFLFQLSSSSVDSQVLLCYDHFSIYLFSPILFVFSVFVLGSLTGCILFFVLKFQKFKSGLWALGVTAADIPPLCTPRKSRAGLVFFLLHRLWSNSLRNRWFSLTKSILWINLFRMIIRFSSIYASSSLNPRGLDRLLCTETNDKTNKAQ
jgi:hypothetical protein